VYPRGCSKREEIGWTGFAFPKLRLKLNLAPAAIVLGILWGAWHLPAINYLGAAVPHGHYWFAFFLVFTFAMTAMRALISWTYENTRSLLLAQLMHISSTGALVIFSPPVSPAQETMWYALYGCLLWLVAMLILTARSGQSARLEHGNE
jgi:CAAX protease family protein